MIYSALKVNYVLHTKCLTACRKYVTVRPKLQHFKNVNKILFCFELVYSQENVKKYKDYVNILISARLTFELRHTSSTRGHSYKLNIAYTLFFLFC